VVADLVVWHGNTVEMLALMSAIEHNCECKGRRGSCAAHQALLTQRFIDGVIFVRWMRERLLAEEQHD
jgi:hypothetical protein